MSLDNGVSYISGEVYLEIIKRYPQLTELEKINESAFSKIKL